MNTREAVMVVLLREGISKYRLAKNLGIQPIMVDNYLGPKSTRMSKPTADKFTSLYNIEISDVYQSRKNIDETKTSSNSSS